MNFIKKALNRANIYLMAEYILDKRYKVGLSGNEFNDGKIRIRKSLFNDTIHVYVMDKEVFKRGLFITEIHRTGCWENYIQEIYNKIKNEEMLKEENIRKSDLDNFSKIDDKDCFQ